MSVNHLKLYFFKAQLKNIVGKLPSLPIKKTAILKFLHTANSYDLVSVNLIILSKITAVKGDVPSSQTWLKKEITAMLK